MCVTLITVDDSLFFFTKFLLKALLSVARSGSAVWTSANPTFVVFPTLVLLTPDAGVWRWRLYCREAGFSVLYSVSTSSFPILLSVDYPSLRALASPGGLTLLDAGNFLGTGGTRTSFEIYAPTSVSALFLYKGQPTLLCFGSMKLSFWTCTLP